MPIQQRAQSALGAAAAAALVLFGGSASAQSCAATMPSVCLESFGAGAIAVNAAAQEAGCVARLQAYRDCIAAMVRDGDAAPRTLTREEIAFLKILEAELADNLAQLEALLDILSKDRLRRIRLDEWPALRRQFFGATQNPAYLAAPPEWLARTQGFYADAEALLGDENWAIFRVHGQYDPSAIRVQAYERLERLVTLGRQELMPEIGAALASGAR